MHACVEGAPPRVRHPTLRALNRKILSDSHRFNRLLAFGETGKYSAITQVTRNTIKLWDEFQSGCCRNALVIRVSFEYWFEDAAKSIKKAYQFCRLAHTPAKLPSSNWHFYHAIIWHTLMLHISPLTTAAIIISVRGAHLLTRKKSSPPTRAHKCSLNAFLSDPPQKFSFRWNLHSTWAKRSQTTFSAEQRICVYQKCLFTAPHPFWLMELPVSSALSWARWNRVARKHHWSGHKRAWNCCNGNSSGALRGWLYEFGVSYKVSG